MTIAPLPPSLFVAHADVRDRSLQIRSAAFGTWLLTVNSPMLQRPARVPLRRHNLEHLAQLLSTRGTAGRLDLGVNEAGVVPIVRVIHGQIETQTTMLHHVTVIAERRATMSTDVLRYRVLLPVADAELIATQLQRHLADLDASELRLSA